MSGATSRAAIFGRNLRAQRERRGLTQREVARDLGIAVEAYGRLERGLALPRAQTLVALAELLDVSTDSLLGVAVARSRHSQTLVEEVGEPKAAYRVAGRAELRRLVRRLERMGPAEIRLFAQLAALVVGKRAGGGNRTR